VFRVPQWVGDEPTGSHDPAGAEQIRCRGALIDQTTREFITTYLAALKVWVLRFK
jgi:hypothetical protein